MPLITDWEHIEQENYEPARVLPAESVSGSHYRHHVAVYAPLDPDANKDSGYVSVLYDDYGNPEKGGYHRIVPASDPDKLFLDTGQFVPGHEFALTRGGKSMIFREIEPFIGSAFQEAHRFLIIGDIPISRGRFIPGVWLETGKSITPLFPDHDIDTAGLTVNSAWLSKDPQPEPAPIEDRPIDTSGWVPYTTEFRMKNGEWALYRRVNGIPGKGQIVAELPSDRDTFVLGFFDPAGKFAGAIERMEDWADIARPVETRAAQPG